MSAPDWTRLSEDPNDRNAKAAVREWLPRAREA